MDQQTLPNSQAILILGILSIPLCCCYGVVGLVLGVVALVLAKKAQAEYDTNPEGYSGIKKCNYGKNTCDYWYCFKCAFLTICNLC